MTVKEVIEILKTMPQEAQVVAAQNGGGYEAVYSIHTEEVNELHIRDVKLTVVVVDLN